MKHYFGTTIHSVNEQYKEATTGKRSKYVETPKNLDTCIHGAVCMRYNTCDECGQYTPKQSLAEYISDSAKVLQALDSTIPLPLSWEGKYHQLVTTLARIIGCPFTAEEVERRVQDMVRRLQGGYCPAQEQGAETYQTRYFRLVKHLADRLHCLDSEISIQNALDTVVRLQDTNPTSTEVVFAQQQAARKYTRLLEDLGQFLRCDATPNAIWAALKRNPRPSVEPIQEGSPTWRIALPALDAANQRAAAAADAYGTLKSQSEQEIKELRALVAEQALELKRLKEKKK